MDFHVGQITDQYGNPKITSKNFSSSDYIHWDFEAANDSVVYLNDLTTNILRIAPVFTYNSNLHHRGLKIENTHGQYVDFRPDHGFGGGWFSPVRYYNVLNVNANSPISKNNKSPEVLFYVKIHR